MGTRWRKTSSAAGPALVGLALLLVPPAGLAPRAAEPGGDPPAAGQGAGSSGSGGFLGAPETPEFKKAIRLLQDPAPPRRAEGEKLIRAMGRRAIPQLQGWIARSEADLDRVRGLLLDLGGTLQGAEDPLSAARPFLAGALAGAWSSFRAGEHAEARRTAEAVLRLDPESPELWEIRRLIRQCEERLISSEILAPSLEFPATVYGLGETPPVHFRLQNRSRSALAVRAERGLLGSLQVTFHRSFLDGSRRSVERTLAIRTAQGEEGFVLEPGESYRREIALELDEPLPPRGMVLRVRAVGKFQPSGWGIEEKNLSRTLSLPPAECWLVPGAEKGLCEAPLRKLETGLFLRDLHGYFIGGQLAVWAAENDPLLNERLLRILVESLGDLDDTGLLVADALLEASSGVKRDRRITASTAITEHWRRWWTERGQRLKEAFIEPPPVPGFLGR